MTTPPDFGGTEMERSLEEELGVPADELEVPGGTDRDALPQGDHEAHAPGQLCALCGTVIRSGQNVRHRPDGVWVHEVCPPVELRHAGETGTPE